MIKIIQVGKTKSEEIISLCAYFEKLVSGFVAVETITLNEVKPGKTFSFERCKQEEGEKILKAISEDWFVIALSEEGKLFDSVQFAEKLGQLKDRGQKVCFVIGGAFGLAEEVKERADLLLSMSKMTFTHQMVRMILLEQVYRGFCILAGKEYHH